MARKRVVVVLEYDGKRLRANGTISFETAQPNMRVLAAQAEMVDGVRYANCGLGDTGQELEVRITAFHAQSMQAAVAVMTAVARKLKVAVIGEIRVDDETEADPDEKTGSSKKRKKKAKK
jgi:hypothetical protein